MNYKSFAVATGLILGLSLIAMADGDKKNYDPKKLPVPSPKASVTYDQDIKPIFEVSCIKCHSKKPDKKAAAGLELTSLEGVKKGGKEGPDIIPGSSDKSPLVYMVAHVGDEDDFMPPPKKKDFKRLTDEQVGLIRTWIDQGAK